jgi:hypothetical protein
MGCPYSSPFCFSFSVACVLAHEAPKFRQVRGPLPSVTATAAARSEAIIQIGGMAVCVTADDTAFLAMLRDRYDGFVSCAASVDFRFDANLAVPEIDDPDADVRLTRRAGGWTLMRGDFRAEWDIASQVGKIQLSPNPYSIDALLRILHTLTLAKQGGFLLHAAGAIRNGKAFLFPGVSGAGKTTIASLAPRNVTLLTDEISYVRKSGDSYIACGTPFSGELGKPGENVSAPLGAVYVLAKGPENRVDSLPAAEAARAILSNLLFFAEDPELVFDVFHAACEFAARTPVFRLTFFPDSRVWELIQ